MSSLFSYSIAGLFFLLISSLQLLLPTSKSRHLPPSLLSLLFILHSLHSLLTSTDPIGYPLPLSSLLISLLFLLSTLSSSLSLPFSPLLLLSSFSLELLYFSLRRKDTDGIENRYFDLLLLPILLCALSTLLSIARPKSPYPPLSLSAGLALHGTWFIQMGFSFFSTAISHGCSLHQRSPGNYTIKCNSHMDYHRARAVATLQFNCHLALMVVVGLGVYSVLAGRVGGGGAGYRPLSKELVRMEGGDGGRFTLESDEDEEKVVVSEARNGFGGPH